MTRFPKLTAAPLIVSSLFVASLAILPIAASAQPASMDSKPPAQTQAAKPTEPSAPVTKRTVAVKPAVKHAAIPASGTAKTATPAVTTAPAQPKTVDQGKS